MPYWSSGALFYSTFDSIADEFQRNSTKLTKDDEMKMSLLSLIRSKTSSFFLRVMLYNGTIAFNRFAAVRVYGVPI